MSIPARYATKEQPNLILRREYHLTVWRTVAEALMVICGCLLAWAIWLQVTR